jgi:DNA-binding LacI/PurR family transcriptional regulator
MTDVAASVGASSSDVALVLAADQRVEPQLRRQILEAIDATGYRPFEAIQAQLGRPLRLAIVLKTHRGDDPWANRFYAPIASAIAVACVKRGAEIVQGQMTVDEHYKFLEIPSALTDRSCDAAFLVGTQLDAEAVELLRATMCPLVLVDGYSAGDALDSVVTDNVAGAKMAVEHLIAAGHREIALFGTEPVCYPSMQDRRTGYAQALEARGLRTHFIDTGYVLADTAAVLGVDYIERHPDVTALFGANDFVTVGFMQVARDAGYHLPADISLVGFDDIDLASLVMPALTTLAIDKTLMGRAGFALLAHRLEVQATEPVRAVVTPRLIERESVVPPRPR